MKHIIVGITGGIAAYKALELISQLCAKGYEVRVVMTPNASHVVSKKTCEILSGHRVFIDEWDSECVGSIEHISLALWADAIIVAPATYNTIGAIASGLANTMLTCIISACNKPVFLALAMNEVMYMNPILQKNIEYLTRLGYIIIDVDEGMLACGIHGKGRLKNVTEIIDIVEEKLSFYKKKFLLEGKKVLITAGRTEEYIDPVRYISNRSSGRMGFALAHACAQEGADVILIVGKHSVPLPHVYRCIQVGTAEEMLQATVQSFDECDVCIACAAVADYTVKKYHTNKMKKTSTSITIELERTKDILAELVERKTTQFLVGFALETENLIENAHEKLRMKSLDMIIANESSAIDAEFAKVFICYRNGVVLPIEYASKKEIAIHIVEAIAAEL